METPLDHPDDAPKQDPRGGGTRGRKQLNWPAKIVCTTCNTLKARTRFGNNGANKKTGKRHVCKACERVRLKDRAPLTGKALSIEHPQAERPAPKAELIVAEMQALGSSNRGAISAGAFQDIITTRMELYRCCALDALYDLASMPISDNSMQNQVKYLAACRLAGVLQPSEQGTPIDATLKQLSEAYHAAAPRIREVRERIVTFETPALNAEG